MNRHDAGNPKYDRWLAYVEGELAPEDVTAFEASLKTGEMSRATLHAMREDRDVLRSIGELTAPADLIDDAMASYERALLIDEMPVAPAIQIQRRRSSVWRRLAVAAALTGLLGGAALLMVRTIDLNRSSGHLEQLVDEVGSEVNDREGLDGDLSSLLAQNDEAVEEETSLESGAVIELEESTADSIAPTWRVSVVADAPPAHSIDVGLQLRVATADMRAALDTLNQSLCVDGGGVVWNLVELTPTVLTREPIGVVSIDDFARQTGRRSDALAIHASHEAPEWNPAQYLIVGPNDLVPFLDQCSYGRDGFQVTLVGTPSRILDGLRSLDRQSGHRISWTRESLETTLSEMRSPPKLTSHEMTRAMTWWREPGQHLDLARQAAASVRPEPVIRIPLRLRPLRAAPRSSTGSMLPGVPTHAD